MSQHIPPLLLLSFQPEEIGFDVGSLLVLLRIASHTVGERTVGYFHLRAVYKDSLIEVIDLFLQLDSMMVPVALGSEY